ncbi:hypothetical protein [Ktedonospora formicarum]|uniref:Uncharacterized protein n=1 Tax=Ktedonospora formicarum TaxID=2778364 RepID=A0A8J3MQ69_9CHLR|nr:hypothetical protein [Ktedonospora formicarum]GHO44562.1 hypothetical protein KSX_27250 [Ktedonospora formicarum]
MIDNARLLKSLKRLAYLAGIGLGALVVGLGAVALLSAIIMLFWNASMPPLFNARPMDMISASGVVGFLVLGIVIVVLLKDRPTLKK